MMGRLLANISLSAGSKQLLASGIVLLPDDESLLIKLEDGGEELSFEVLIQRADPPPAQNPPQLTFSGISEISGKLTFLNTMGPFGVGYQISLGTINKRKLTANFRVVNLVPMNELKYSFWAGPEANG